MQIRFRILDLSGKDFFFAAFCCWWFDPCIRIQEAELLRIQLILSTGLNDNKDNMHK